MINPSLDNVQAMIEEECDSVKELLLQKNREYGNSALLPKRIFSNANPVEQIKVRIDDKLSRLSSDGVKEIKEDTTKDLLGYLILLRIAQRIYEEPGVKFEEKKEIRDDFFDIDKAFDELLE